MRLLLAIFCCIPVLAQDAPAPAAAEPAGEPQFSVELGNRWSTELKGNSDVYRSLVNLGDGPKVLGLELSLKGSTHHLFDSLRLTGDGWGGEPYSTARLSVQRDRWYRFSGDYRNIAYFNALPSYANPGIDRGVLASQRTFDLRRRMIGTELELMPGRRVVPFLGYSRDWGGGSGVTDFVSDGNEWAVPNILQDKTDNYRGGVRILFDRFHVTLEQGGTSFKDDQRAYLPGGIDYGNRTSSYLGQWLTLTGLNQAYRVRGTSQYSKGLVTASPFSWLNLSGQFLYSLPSSNVKLDESSTGNMFSTSSYTFFTGERLIAATEAKQPHTSASFAAELRPHRRFRVTESLMTDRMHTAASLLSLVDQRVPGGAVSQGATGLERLELNYNRQEFNVLFDVTSRVTLRGGHRYVWGDALTRAPGLSQTGWQRTGEMQMQVGLAGATIRPTSKISLHVDYEGGSADRNYFRTSLQDYHRLQTRARYQVLSSLGLTANFSVLDNQNPSAESRYAFQSRHNSLTAFWNPWGGKWFSLTADYTRSTVETSLSYLVPQTLASDLSKYRERAHTATAVLDVNLPRVSPAGGPRLGLGGSLYVGDGSRPTQFYQPLARVSLPLHRRFSAFGEWRWYNLGERLYRIEGFRVHHLTAGVRISM